MNSKPPLDTNPESGGTIPAVSEGPPMLATESSPSVRSSVPIRPRKRGEIGVPKLNKFKVGSVRVKETAPGEWAFRFVDPVSRKDVKRVLRGLPLAKVKEAALHVASQSMSEAGFLPGRRVSIPMLKAAMVEAIRLSRGNERTKADYVTRGNWFLRWVAERYPRVTTAADVRPATVQEYVNELEARGQAPASVRLRLVPVKMTIRYMAENYPDHVRPLPRIRMKAGAKKAPECLSVSEVIAYLDWLETNRPALHGMATVGFLAGLRMLEVSSLRRQDIDFGRGTVSIVETHSHVPKTESSRRTIPVSSEVLEALREAVESVKAIPIGGEVFLSRYGLPWTLSGMVHAWPRVRKRAALELGLSRIGEIPAHKMRSFFATTASRSGVSDRLLKAYLGHVPGDMLGGHYRMIDLGELRAVSAEMENWRSLSDGRQSGRILETAKSESL